jgi:ATP-dependent Clp protease protease subunit
MVVNGAVRKVTMMSMPSFPPEFPRDPSGPGRPDLPGYGAGRYAPGGPDPADLLLQRRIVLLDGHLDGLRATDLSARLIMLDGAGEGTIALHLRTMDAELDAAFAVADTIGLLNCPVDALVAGLVGGSALVVLTAARRRELTAHAMLRLTEPAIRAEGDTTDVAAVEEEHRRRVDAYFIRLADVTGREVDELREDARAGRLFTAEQAVEYGFADAVARTAPGGPG